jgi:hypothetical protein
VVPVSVRIWASFIHKKTFRCWSMNKADKVYEALITCQRCQTIDGCVCGTIWGTTWGQGMTIAVDMAGRGNDMSAALHNVQDDQS